MAVLNKSSLEELRERMFGGKSTKETEDEEKLEIKKISFEKDEVFLTNEEPHVASYYKPSNEINLQVYTVFNSLFADLTSAKIEHGFMLPQYSLPLSKEQLPNKWLFIMSFQFIPDNIYAEMKKEENLPRAINSSYNPSNHVSLGESVMAINRIQGKAPMDMSKYASLSKEAKEFLTPFALEVGNKRKLIPGQNLFIKEIASNGATGYLYKNIQVDVLLDAEVVLKTLCVAKGDEKKYEIAIESPSTAVDGINRMILIKRINNRARKALAKYGAIATI